MKNKLNFKKNKNKRKSAVYVVIIIFILIFIIFFCINNYKNKKFGNNMSSKNIEENLEYILNISSYKANMDITIQSNKNSNKYVIEQTYVKGKKSVQKVLQPSNIEGIEIKYEEGKLIINNTKLNLTKVYENYDYLIENCLWLDSFIKDYEEGKDRGITKNTEGNDIIVLETRTRNENNKYIYYKKLYIDKKTGKPTKLLVQDINKKNLIYILYNDIELNSN